jgi:hypothetical protein
MQIGISHIENQLSFMYELASKVVQELRQLLDTWHRLTADLDSAAKPYL